MTLRPLWSARETSLPSASGRVKAGAVSPGWSRSLIGTSRGKGRITPITRSAVYPTSLISFGPSTGVPMGAFGMKLTDCPAQNQEIARNTSHTTTEEAR
ncbi:hypothetical protein SY2F82_09810 [Streptomyces sp. Y2F8-2]|nr:hypothetical protein SY2F82_09810 [Streptomyces sp. Y2F8-2]